MSSLELPLPVVSRNQSQSSSRSAGLVRQTAAALTPPVGVVASADIASTHEMAVDPPDNTTAEGGDDDGSLGPGPYFDYVKYVTGDSPILDPRFVRCGRPDKIDVIVLDVREDGTCLTPKCFGKTRSIFKYLKSASKSPEPLSDSDIENLIHPASALEKFLEESKSPDIIVRLVLVEDLSPATVEALGSALNLDPGVFSEHLLGAQIGRDGHKECIGKVVDRMKLTNHFSWSWKRPMSSTFENFKLSHGACANILRPRMLVNPQPIFKHHLQAMAERSFWTAINMDDLFIGRLVMKEFVMAARATTGLKTDLGIAGERISFHSKDDDHCLTGIFLFDHLRDVHYHTLGGNPYRYITSARGRSGMNRVLSFREFTRSPRLKEKSLKPDPSTRNWFVTHLTNTMDGGGEEGCTCGSPMDARDIRSLFHPILHCILYDWWYTLEAIEMFLDETNTNSTRSGGPRDQLGMVKIYGDLRKVLVEGSEDIRAVVETIGEKAFGEKASGEKAPSEKIFGGLKNEPQYLLNRIENLKDRMERFSNSLVSTMSILESKKAISEAESISRLTELAFFFIPLSFATSVFGMQITGWSENYRPYMWPLISGLLVLGVYALRYAVHRVRYKWSHVMTTEYEETPTIMIQGFRQRNLKIRQMHREGFVPKLWIMIWFIDWHWFKIFWVVWSVVPIAVVWGVPSSSKAKIIVTVIFPFYALVFIGGLIAIRQFRAWLTSFFRAKARAPSVYST